MRTVAATLVGLLLVGAANAACSIGGAPTYEDSTGKLVIYTYDSFFQYPDPLDFVASFAEVASIDVNDVDVYCFSDAPTLLKAAIDALASTNLTNQRAPHVVVGLDNVLQFQASASMFYDYASPMLSELLPEIVARLNISGAAKLIPFDYSAITLVANLDVLHSNGVPDSLINTINSTTFQLDTLVQHASTLIPQLVIEDPSLSGTGLSLLMWAIATYGDKSIDLVGAMGADHDWRTFWRALVKNGVDIEASWDDAFAKFDNGEYGLISSYLTDGAYADYTDSPHRVVPVLSHHDGSAYAWLNVEGMGITAATVDQPESFDLAKQFVDYILSADIQAIIPFYQWTYPVNKNVAIPNLYYTNNAVPDAFTYANTFIPIPTLSSNLRGWVDEAVAIQKNPDSGAASAIGASIVTATVAAVVAAVAARA